jgi:hypothetical protein
MLSQLDQTPVKRAAHQKVIICAVAESVAVSDCHPRVLFWVAILRSVSTPNLECRSRSNLKCSLVMFSGIVVCHFEFDLGYV